MKYVSQIRPLYFCQVAFELGGSFDQIENSHAGSSLILQPGLARVLQNNLAVFNCSYSCTIRTNRTHTISWLVGDVNERLLVRGNEHVFTARSGLQVEVKDMSSDCPPDTKQPAMAIEQLIINGTSAELFNRTAVQCVAIPRSEDVATIYSSYSVMLIDIPVRGKLLAAHVGYIPEGSHAMHRVLPQ